MNDELNPDAPKFDLFATEVEDNLKEELAKGTFQWTDKYTKVLSLLLAVVGLLSVGTWYGHYEATKTPTIAGAASFASLRAAFGGGGGFGGGATGGATGTGAAAGGGFGGFGGTRVTGTIQSVKGSTVTITLDDPTQASSLTAGDAARVSDTGAAGGAAIGAPASGSTTTGKHSSSSGSSTTSSAPAPAASPAATNGTARRGGAFSNPALTACLKKAGITFTAGTRPNFQDPATAQAIQTCFTQLGITPGGGFGGGPAGGAAGGSAPAPAATK
jgi:hypothetical protein